MKCKNCVNLECDWCDMKADSPDPDIERDCHWFAQKTNADRIRAMTDEELAEYLAPCACPPIRFNKNTGDIVCPVNKEPCESDCKSCWLDWLKEEYTDALYGAKEYYEGSDDG